MRYKYTDDEGNITLAFESSSNLMVVPPDKTIEDAEYMTRNEFDDHLSLQDAIAEQTEEVGNVFTIMDQIKTMQAEIDTLKANKTGIKRS